MGDPHGTFVAPAEDVDLETSPRPVARDDGDRAEVGLCSFDLAATEPLPLEVFGEQAGGRGAGAGRGGGRDAAEERTSLDRLHHLEV